MQNMICRFRSFPQVGFLWLLPLLILQPLTAVAQTVEDVGERLDLTASWVGITAVILFVLAYCLVIAEEFTHLRKSKPVILAAGLIWALIGLTYAQNGIDHTTEEAVREFLVEVRDQELEVFSADPQVLE